MPEEEVTVASEDETLLGGESGNDFDIDRWQARLAAGKYDGHVVVMAAMLHDHAIKANTRRWRCTFRDVVYTEDDIDGDVAEHAERYAQQGWGYLTATLGDNVRAVIKPARAILYGICRGELSMSDRDARRAIKLPAKEVMGCFDWYEVESPGKPEGPA